MESKDEINAHSNRDGGSPINSAPVDATAENEFTRPVQATRGSISFVFGQRFPDEALTNDASRSEPDEAVNNLDNFGDNSENAYSALRTSNELQERTINPCDTVSVEDTPSISNSHRDILDENDNTQSSPLFSPEESSSNDSFDEECGLLYDTLWPNGESNEEGLEDLGSKFSLSDYLEDTSNHKCPSEQDLSNNSVQSNNSSGIYKSCPGNGNGNKSFSSTTEINASASQVPQDDRKTQECTGLSSEINSVKYPRIFTPNISNVDSGIFTGESFSSIQSPKSIENVEHASVSSSQVPQEDQQTQECTGTPSEMKSVKCWRIFTPNVSNVDSGIFTGESFSSIQSPKSIENEEQYASVSSNQVPQDQQTQECTGTSSEIKSVKCWRIFTPNVSNVDSGIFTGESFSSIQSPKSMENEEEYASANQSPRTPSPSYAEDLFNSYETTNENYENTTEEPISYSEGIVCNEDIVEPMTDFDSEIDETSEIPCCTSSTTKRDNFVHEDHDVNGISVKRYLSKRKDDPVSAPSYRNIVSLRREDIDTTGMEDASERFVFREPVTVSRDEENQMGTSPDFQKTSIDESYKAIIGSDCPWYKIRFQSENRRIPSDTNFAGNRNLCQSSVLEEPRSVEGKIYGDESSMHKTANGDKQTPVSLSRTPHVVYCRQHVCSTTNTIDNEDLGDKLNHGLSPRPSTKLETDSDSSRADTSIRSTSIISSTPLQSQNSTKDSNSIVSASKEETSDDRKIASQNLQNEQNDFDSTSISISDSKPDSKSTPESDSYSSLTSKFTSPQVILLASYDPFVLQYSETVEMKCEPKRLVVKNEEDTDEGHSDSVSSANISDNIFKMVPEQMIDDSQSSEAMSQDTATGTPDKSCNDQTNAFSKVTSSTFTWPDSSSSKYVQYSPGSVLWIVSTESETPTANGSEETSTDLTSSRTSEKHNTQIISEPSTSAECDSRSIRIKSEEAMNPPSVSEETTPIEASTIASIESEETNVATSSFAYAKCLNLIPVTDAPAVIDSRQTHQDPKDQMKGKSRKRKRASYSSPVTPGPSVVENLPSTSSEDYRRKLRHNKHRTVDNQPPASQASSSELRKRKRTESLPITYMTRAKMRKMMQDAVRNVFGHGKKSPK